MILVEAERCGVDVRRNVMRTKQQKKKFVPLGILIGY